MNKIAIAASLIAVLPTAQCQEPSSQEWREDLSFLVETLEAVHPDPFGRTDSETYSRAVTELGAGLDALGDAEVAIELMRIVHRIADGHTNLRPRGRVLALDRWYPWHVERFVDGFFVVGAGPEVSHLLGAQVTSISGLPVADVWERLLEISFGDNIFGLMAGAKYYLSMPSVLAALGVTSGTQLVVELILRSGQRESVAIPAVESDIDFNRFLDGWWPPSGEGAVLPDRSEVDLYYQHPDLPYWAMVDSTSKTLYARIKQVADARDPVLIGHETASLSLAEYTARLFELLDEELIETFVIDLRGNSGGNNQLVVPLVEGLGARPWIAQRGRLFVLVDRYTFSAAMNLVSMLEDRTEAIFVGEPPGAAPRHYGDNTGFSLPNSGLRLNVSTLRWEKGVAPDDVRQVMEPDMWAPLSSEAVLAGRDPALAAIRAYPEYPPLADRLLQTYRTSGLPPALSQLGASAAENPTGPWNTSAQQSLDFAYAVIENDASGDDIYATFQAVAEAYPGSVEAWFALGRVLGWGRRWAEAQRAFERAQQLRPHDDLIRRMVEVARRSAAN